MIPVWLLLMFITCGLLSLVLCWFAKLLFPRFRSGEFKPGPHRPDLQPDGPEIKTIELPLVGGPAITLSIIATGIGAGFIFKLNQEQWALLLIGLGATFGYMIVGLIDDWFKVHHNEGISERAKFAGVLLVSMAAAFCYYMFTQLGQQPYSPYLDILGPLFRHFPVIWLIFLMLLTGLIGSVTSISVDFSDGLDGLAGGLVFSAALAFGIIFTGLLKPGHSEGIVMEILALLCASSVLGYLRWNWPSPWAARRSKAKRHARLYMGDSGALSLGGILAMMAILSHNEILLLLIGAAFVLEGLSALMSAKVLTPFFRKRLQLLRYASLSEFVPHTEFPLPFLATPLHHHFDLLGWNRQRLVYGAWALGACFAALGVLVYFAPETWQRYLGRILVLILAWFIWSSGSYTRRYFVGKHPAERTRRRRLALFYGYPFQLWSIKFYHRVEIIEANEDVIETPAEELALWQRMNIFDARAMLGLYCYRAGYYPAALLQWTHIPEKNRKLRPNIQHLLEELEMRLAMETQETQPLRRDQILQKPPIITGNLSPADLPNPYEPITSETDFDEHVGNGFSSIPPSSHSALNNADAAQTRHTPSPISSPSPGERDLSRPHNDLNGRSSEEEQLIQPTTAPVARNGWLTRRRHSSSSSDDSRDNSSKK
jgi:UDP-N-acetylmuramyl pentapeptide phosphotransferase/UDP-N-acetylglucosamine-1-phosphate transferase